MIKSKGAKGKARVTFTIDPQVGAQTAAVCGEWNDWSADAGVMQPDAEGGFSVTVDLDPGRAYRFRYLLDGQRWDNDWAADAYVRNEFGGDDSVVDLTAPAEAVPRAARKAPAKKEAAKKASPAKEAAVAGAVPPTAKKVPAREAQAKEAAEAEAVPSAARRAPAKKTAPGQTAEKAPPATKRAGMSAKEAASAQAARKAVPAKRPGKTAK